MAATAAGRAGLQWARGCEPCRVPAGATNRCDHAGWLTPGTDRVPHPSRRPPMKKFATAILALAQRSEIGGQFLRQAVHYHWEILMAVVACLFLFQDFPNLGVQHKLRIGIQ